MKLKKHKRRLLLINAILIFICAGLITRDSNEDPEMDLPAIHMSLNDCTLEEIHDGATGIPYEGNTLDLDGKEYTNVRVKGRGNSSWKMPRRSYQIKLHNRDSVLGMPQAKKWLLIANYADASMMRNKLMYDLPGQMMDFAPQSEFADLWIDGDYQGVCLVCQRIATGKTSLNLKSEQGILAEIDTFYWHDADSYFKSNYSPAVFTLKDSPADDMEKEDSLARKSFSDFEDYVRRFEDLLYAEEKDWEQISSMMDVDSFVAFYLLEEFSENPDSCRTSLYMYQDGPDDVLHMGPVWDFDKALGYAQKGKYGGDPERDYVSNIQEYMGTENDCTWYTELMKIPEFQDAVQDYYQTTARDVFLSSGQLIEDYRHRIAKSAEYTESIWPVAEIAENCGHDPVQFSCWNDAVDYLKNWTKKRIQYFDQKWISSN